MLTIYARPLDGPAYYVTSAATLADALALVGWLIAFTGLEHYARKEG
ncbi:hypothetical protein [Caudoviricetes sp.]|nr:hypothetical protein [Caudoviricetes sp.]UOF81121.1 hypothetical protein [Caudoviricetes sp.]UOF82243.1 hypothetical protein [Caudoviricetes sp.]UOF82466.1 hypothetical protein [Caudoviricetes sp.]UOF82620.1 hypothetical protein [Caudoviricetes sp.]